ncbi:unnamed protein product [Prorocentrum cordatum]|uniref:Uncharacterized protein n=1 Tax=Prorocentrum cordatum TaxID=2364126 RepID=A0ABN9TBG0_9DINO|nr:unnamed protein product [Polarella glacialis]
MLFRLCAVSAALFLGARGASLRAEPAHNNASKHAAVDDAAKIGALREKLLKMSAGLSKIVDPHGPLAKTELGPEMAEFNARVHAVISSTAGKGDRKSLEQLEEAMGSVTGLVKDLNKQQSRLMQESEEQQDSLLPGVLTTKKGEPMDSQLEILKAPDFAGMAVTKAILAGRDLKTPLFQQVANFPDARGGTVAGGTKRSGAAASGLSSAAVSQIVTSLQARLSSLEANTRHAEEAHANATRRARALEKSKDNRSAKIMRAIERKEDRKFQKMLAIRHQDISTMKAAITAVEHGDMQGLERAKAALESSMKNMQSHNSGFLVLIQEGLRASGLDCPFCAAQCVDKCHEAGKAYVECLTDCQDAGK